MAKNQKTNRTQIKDLATSEKQLTASETHNVKGGAKGIKDIKIGLGVCGTCRSAGHSTSEHGKPGV